MPSVLRDALKACCERIERYGGRRVGEQNTKAALIEPVIAALGWDVLDPDEVHREYRRRSNDNPVDYALLIARRPRLFIEAKGLGENLDDSRWADQTVNYANLAGVEWVALTDGREWRVYNAPAAVPVEDKLFRSVRICQDIDTAVELLTLLGRDNMRENRIEELWRAFHIDRQVKAALDAMFIGEAGPPLPLVNLIRRYAPTLQAGDVRASLGRVRAGFDFPDVTAGPGGALMPPPSGPRMPRRPAQSPAATTTAPLPPARPTVSMKISAAERTITLTHLLDQGLLAPGAELVARYLDRTLTARLNADGTLNVEGVGYRSLSGAGRAAKITVAGHDASGSVLATDGWLFWSVRCEDGTLTSLRVLRRRAAGR